MQAGNNQGVYAGSPNGELPVEPTLSAILRKAVGPAAAAYSGGQALNALLPLTPCAHSAAGSAAPGR